MSTELLKRAIKTGDWNLVYQAYQALTGEKVVLDKQGKVKQIRKAKAQQDLPKVQERAIVNGVQSWAPPNTWVDDLTLCRDSIKIDKKIKRSIQPRRDPVQIVSITCTKCGRANRETAQVAALYRKPEDESSEKPSYRCC